MANEILLSPTSGAKIARVYPENDECYNVRCGAAITRGQALYQMTTGLYDVAQADSATKCQFRGIALEPGLEGDAITMLKQGFMAGYALGTYEDEIYLSDTPGAFSTVAGTYLVKCGRVASLPDRGLTEVGWFEADWLHEWGSADYDAP